ncbi:MAG TPA: hypothetical protein VLV87_02680 [Gammaproteobacteria bacterium]|nr:hypothetical protein [Gammaproteobacteria bacterium]
MRSSHALLVAALLCIGGCATLAGDSHAQELADNRADDGYCIDHGLRYPDPGYVQCRRQLVDRRLYRDWRNLQSIQRTRQPTGNIGSAPSSSFRSPDPASFHCHVEPQFGNDYIFCGYDLATGPG